MELSLAGQFVVVRENCDLSLAGQFVVVQENYDHQEVDLKEDDYYHYPSFFELLHGMRNINNIELMILFY